MRRSLWPGVARQLQSEVPDADLLERYVQGRDDDAFAQLLTRYSRLVWGQCRNLLTNDADADDAFQAVFLTLARSARTIRPGAPLGPWLHGVAFRVSKNARRANGRRTKREQATALPETNRPVADSTWEVAFAAVAEEVQKLPEAQRAAFILCCIEGRATTEAAASLGQKLGTFSARLTRAKQTLLNRLSKRGIGAGVLALGGITGTSTVAPAALIVRTLTLIPSGVVVPSSILTLTHGVTGMMMIRLKLLAAGVLVATGFGLSVGGGWSSSVEAQGPGAGSSGGSLGAPPGSVGGFGQGSGETPPPAKAPPKAEQLKAELEKAKADYEKSKLEYDSLMDKKRKQDAGEQYAYDAVPKEGFRTEVFQANLTERRKAGWSFLGQVSLNVGEASPKQYLAFHKPGRAPAGGFGGPGSMMGAPVGMPGGGMGMPGASGMSLPPGGGPSLPPAATTIPGGAGGPLPFGTGLADSAGLPGETSEEGGTSGSAPSYGFSQPSPSIFTPASPMPYAKGPPMLATQPSFPVQLRENIPEVIYRIPPTSRNNEPEVGRELTPAARIHGGISTSPPLIPGENRPTLSNEQDRLPTPTVIQQKKLSKKTDAEYEARIAALEKRVQTLLGDPHRFTVTDYGNWDPKELVDVLRKVVADETIEYKLFEDHFQATGTPESLKAVGEWVKKLKKEGRKWVM